MVNVTNQVAAEVVPQFGNVSTMFNVIIGFAILGFIGAIIFVIYSYFS